MALTSNDLKQIRSIVNEEVSSQLAPSETRLQDKIDGVEQRLEAKINESAKQIRLEVGDFISDQVLPLFDDLATKSDIDRLERKLDREIDTNIIQNNRLGKIESTPTVALELKKKK